MSAMYAKASTLKNTLPLLPGNNFTNKNRHDFRKSQMLQYSNGHRMASTPKTYPAELVATQEKISLNDIQQAHPSWLTLDNKILRFYCYFKESIHESREENARVRRCNLYYYLEDDTIQVTEPKQDNSGVPQGNLVKRHKVPKIHGAEEHYTVDDLNVGADIVIYSKTFHIVDCDAFTRYFYSQLGRPLRPFEEYPEDAHLEKTITVKQSMHPNKPKDPDHREWKRFNEYEQGGRMNLFNYDEREAARSFFENDRKVLQFSALWDDTKTLHGDARHFTVLYFLADHTVKVLEKTSRNNGRDPFPVFLRKQKLAKVKCPAADCNLETMSTRPQEYVTWEDLMIGKTVSVCGRDMLLYDCDDFTKKFYSSKYRGLDFTPLDVSAPPQQSNRMEPPPHRGFGSPEDSLVSWSHLVLKPPKKDLRKLQERDGDVLTFGGYLETQPERRLIIVFRCADDTLGIFEAPGRNTGFTGGKFLQRQKVKKPMEGNATLTMEAPYYTEDDFYVGARLDINSHIIIIDKIDEHTVRYLEGAPKDFSADDMDKVVHKIRGMLLNRFSKLTDTFRAMDMDHNGGITIKELDKVCRHLNIVLSEHELLCLMRYLDEDANGTVEYYEFVRKMAPKDYEGELDAGKGTVRLTEIADPLDKSYQKVAQGQDAQRESDKVFKMFRDKLNSQRFMALDLFRMMSDRAFDSRVGEKEFRYGVVSVLQLNMEPRQIDLLVNRVFPFPGKRLTQKEFNRMMSSGPHFETTYCG
uniref:EF-hand domain-containing family member C2 n=1 Tax=Eutreptiella gymnastica TaxID=73025 RepID=A0A7S4LEL9_9EUGL